jgi:hypothetical protein
MLNYVQVATPAKRQRHHLRNEAYLAIVKTVDIVPKQVQHEVRKQVDRGFQLPQDDPSG